MNFLAHLYLSGEEDDVVVGNFIGDYVKGKNYLKYPGKIQNGILLHRHIDSFTDSHELVKEIISYFREGYGRYSGIVVDVVFDHILAINWHLYSDYKLRDFTRKINGILLSRFTVLPGKVQRFLPIMIHSKRLESYATISGIKRALEIMKQYTSLPSGPDYAIYALQKHNELISQNFKLFIGELITYVESDFNIKIKKPVEKYSG